MEGQEKLEDMLKISFDFDKLKSLLSSLMSRQESLDLQFNKLLEAYNTQNKINRADKNNVDGVIVSIEVSFIPLFYFQTKLLDF